MDLGLSLKEFESKRIFEEANKPDPHMFQVLQSETVAMSSVQHWELSTKCTQSYKM